MTKPIDRLSLKNPWHLLATGFGSGLAPLIPGTVGTLAAIPIYLILAQLPFTSFIIVVVLAAIVGVAICDRTAFDMRVYDHGSIVWDEFIGFWITMAFIPLLNLPLYDWKTIGLGFVLFRLFDMVKPFPICWLDEHIDGGVGIMVDDLVAGIMAGVSLYGVCLVLEWV